MSAIRNKRILVVEDEFLIACMATEMLTELGAVAVGPAGSVAEGLELIGNETIDAVLLDVNLQGEHSDTLLRALRQRQLPFVITTGYNPATWSAQGMLVVSKPYTQHKLAEALQKIFT